MEAILKRKGARHDSYAKGTRGTAFSLLSRQRGTEPDEFQITSWEGTGQHRAFDSMHNPSVQSVRANSSHLQWEFPNSSREVHTPRILNRAAIQAEWHSATPGTATRAQGACSNPMALTCLAGEKLCQVSVSFRVRMPTHGLEQHHSRSLAGLLSI